ncbi:hypothetical protein BH18ACT15_BH18ACT15_00710 [soil metagenome]
MEIKNSFEVPGSIERVWAHLLDVEKVAACMPGAQLTETIDERHYKGRVTIKLGPMSMSFAGTVEMTEVDDDAHRIVLKAKGQEQRGKGAAQATITATLAPVATGTRADVEQHLTITGQAAQLARGMMQDVSERLTAQFADCLKEHMSERPKAASEVNGGTAPAPPAQPVKAQPVRGLSLVLSALAGAAGRLLGRLRSRFSKG